VRCKGSKHLPEQVESAKQRLVIGAVE
jgi:hypothetical protein